MTKKKTKVTKVMEWLNNGCYPGYVMFSCGFSYDEIAALLKKKKADDWLLGISQDKNLIDSSNWFGLRRTFTREGEHEKKLFYIIITDQFDFSDYDYCKLAHEILHICQFFLPDILERDREIEAEAYYHTHIMQQCLKALR